MTAALQPEGNSKEPDSAQAGIDLLFEPFVSDKLTLANRLVMAPMTRSFSRAESPERMSRNIMRAARLAALASS